MDNSRERFEYMTRRRSGGFDSPEQAFAMLRSHERAAPGDGTPKRGLYQHGAAGLFTEAAVVLAPRRKGMWLARGRPCGSEFQWAQL